MIGQKLASTQGHGVGEETSNLVQGKVSWFEEEGNKTATGIPTSSGGIAICSNEAGPCAGSPTYHFKTLGGWWLVKFPNGKVLVLQQTDIGPASSTNRVLDVAGGSLSAAGYSKNNFPTDSEIKAVYLGKKKPTDAGFLAEAWEKSILNPAFFGAFGTSQNQAGQTLNTEFNFTQAGKEIPNAIKTTKQLIEKIGEILKFLGSSEGWFRIGKVIVGAALLLIAISELAKVGSGSTSPSLPNKAIGLI